MIGRLLLPPTSSLPPVVLRIFAPPVIIHFFRWIFHRPSSYWFNKSAISTQPGSLERDGPEECPVRCGGAATRPDRCNARAHCRAPGTGAYEKLGENHVFQGWTTDWLVVWNMNFIFPYIGTNKPNWLIFCRGGETTNQLSSDMLLEKYVHEAKVNRLNGSLLWTSAYLYLHAAYILWTEEILHHQKDGWNPIVK